MVAAWMCGTPSASRETVAAAEIGAEISPLTWGNGRHAYQYAADASAINKTAMLRLIARSAGVENSIATDCNQCR
jgi:hypothetical protein